MNRGNVPEIFELCNFRFWIEGIVGIEPEIMVCPRTLSTPHLRVVHQHWHTHKFFKRGKPEKASGTVPLNIVFSKNICCRWFTD